MTERNKTINEIIELVQNMDWGVMDNDIDAQELLIKLEKLKTINMETIIMKSEIEILMKLLRREFDIEMSDNSNSQKLLKIQVHCTDEEEFKEKMDEEFTKWLIENEYTKLAK